MAIIYCQDCGRLLGMWYNSQEKQEILYDCFCPKCHNKGIEEHEKGED